MDMKIAAITVLMIAVLMISVVQVIQLNDINTKISATGAVTAKTTNGAPDMTGWTENEKMMYEHHGTLPARLQGQSSSGMVGGC